MTSMKTMTTTKRTIIRCIVWRQNDAMLRQTRLLRPFNSFESEINQSPRMIENATEIRRRVGWLRMTNWRYKRRWRTHCSIIDSAVKNATMTVHVTDLATNDASLLAVSTETDLIGRSWPSDYWQLRGIHGSKLCCTQRPGSDRHQRHCDTVSAARTQQMSLTNYVDMCDHGASCMTACLYLKIVQLTYYLRRIST